MLIRVVVLERPEMLLLLPETQETTRPARAAPYRSLPGQATQPETSLVGVRHYRPVQVVPAAPRTEASRHFLVGLELVVVLQLVVLRTLPAGHHHSRAPVAWSTSLLVLAVPLQVPLGH